MHTYMYMPESTHMWASILGGFGVATSKLWDGVVGSPRNIIISYSVRHWALLLECLPFLSYLNLAVWISVNITLPLQNLFLLSGSSHWERY